jgi:hypothetical protein
MPATFHRNECGTLTQLHFRGILSELQVREEVTFWWIRNELSDRWRSTTLAAPACRRAPGLDSLLAPLVTTTGQLSRPSWELAFCCV